MRASQIGHGRPAGFSTVELIVVIVIAGILAAFVTARFVEKDGFESRGYADQAIAVVRHAQKTAIAQRRNVVVVITADRIAACYDAACGAGQRVAAPFNLNAASGVSASRCLDDATWLCAGRPDGVAGLGTTQPAVTFNGLGRPDSNATITIPGAGAGDVTRQIVIEPETGYVHPA